MSARVQARRMGVVCCASRSPLTTARWHHLHTSSSPRSEPLASSVVPSAAPQAAVSRTTDQA
jgi:hypothetical protein